MSSFENLRIVDNFYQTSLFFPMPTVLISTLCEDGSTNLGPYSLIQPYYVAGKDYYAMLLNCRNSSNTAQNILRTGKCAINFIDDNPKNFHEAVKLSWPGDKPSEKMPKCNFKLEKSLIQEENPEDLRPMVMTDAIEVIECTWMRELDGATVVDKVERKIEEEVTFDKVRAEAESLWNELVKIDAANADKILKKVEIIFGRKIKLSEITEDQKDLMQLVVLDMRDMKREQ